MASRLPDAAPADADEPRHNDVTQVISSERGTLVTTELAAAEADDLILDRLGIDAELGQASAVVARYR